MNHTQCPLPTPELAASLANQYIEELIRLHGAGGLEAARDSRMDDIDSGMAMTFAARAVLGVEVADADGQRQKVLKIAALRLAQVLGYPAPYETQVTLLDGSKQPPERHTITHFVDGEGFSEADWATIAALGVGEAYVIPGQSAVMTVTRVE